ncbi:hypothetical protein QE443_001709 [Pantoea ananatis]|nr:hypothetical protein [Pantoea ananatis]MDR6090054.1 hypothetical protein [Pantoea ananatis]PWV67547.1 hypothetical protein C7425_103594 [Pantoea ananatis]
MAQEASLITLNDLERGDFYGCPPRILMESNFIYIFVIP